MSLRVTRTVVVLILAVIANALGWVLPVVDDYRGWNAFRVGLSPIWPYEPFHIEAWHLILLSVSSALTNGVFVIVAALLLKGGVSARALLWVAAAATLLNLHWVITMEDSRDDLTIGYFIWVVSFALLALAAYLQLPSRRPVQARS